MFRFDQLIRRDMIIRDVKQRHPETIPIFENLRYRASCDDCDIETVARKNGLNSLDVVEALNEAAFGPKARTKMQATSKPAKKKLNHKRQAAARRILFAENCGGHRRHRELRERSDGPYCGTW